MNKKLVFRNLYPDEIQVRPTDTKTKGSCTLLLYKDARSDMDILDETVGAENWQREYYEVKGNVYCRIGIKCGDEWVWKSDCGVESNIDAAKGEASDAAKRAAVAWGIGRELYSGPRIKLNNLPDKYYYNDHLTMTFYVKSIKYEGKTITELAIADRFDNIVFSWNANNPVKPQNKPIPTLEIPDLTEEPQETLNSLQIGLKSFCDRLSGTVDDIALGDFYNYYTKKANSWNGPMNYEALWSGWMDRRRK